MKATDVDWLIPVHTPLAVTGATLLVPRSSLGMAVVSVRGHICGEAVRYILSFHPQSLQCQQALVRWERGGPGFHPVDPTLVPGNAMDVGQSVAQDALFPGSLLIRA